MENIITEIKNKLDSLYNSYLQKESEIAELKNSTDKTYEQIDSGIKNINRNFELQRISLDRKIKILFSMMH